jgi:hypothetical protein
METCNSVEEYPSGRWPAITIPDIKSYAGRPNAALERGRAKA